MNLTERTPKLVYVLYKQGMKFPEICELFDALGFEKTSVSEAVDAYRVYFEHLVSSAMAPTWDPPHFFRTPKPR